MESLLDKLSRNRKRICRFIIVAVSVPVMTYILVIIAINIYGLPDIGDDDPQAIPRPDMPSEKMFRALIVIILSPSMVLDFLRMKAGISRPGIIGGYFLLILPGFF